MAFYFFFFLLMLFISIESHDTFDVPIQNFSLLYLRISIVIVFTAVFLGIRNPSIGLDSQTYIKIFINPKSYPFVLEPGFTALLSLLRRFSGNTQYFLFIMAALINALIVFGYRELDKEYFLFAFLIFMSTFVFYQFNLNIMRQAIAIGISVLFLHNLIQKKYLYSFIFFCVAMSFHITSAVMLLYPLFLKQTKNRKTEIFKIIFIILLFSVGFMKYFLSFIPEVHWSIHKLQEYIRIADPVKIKQTHFMSFLIICFYIAKYETIRKDALLYHLCSFHLNFFMFLALFHEVIMIYDRFYFFLMVIESVILVKYSIAYKYKKHYLVFLSLIIIANSAITVFFWGPRNFITEYKIF